MYGLKIVEVTYQSVRKFSHQSRFSLVHVHSNIVFDNQASYPTQVVSVEECEEVSTVEQEVPQPPPQLSPHFKPLTNKSFTGDTFWR